MERYLNGFNETQTVGYEDFEASFNGVIGRGSLYVNTYWGQPFDYDVEFIGQSNWVPNYGIYEFCSMDPGITFKHKIQVHTLEYSIVDLGPKDIRQPNKYGYREHRVTYEFRITGRIYE